MDYSRVRGNQELQEQNPSNINNFTLSGTQQECLDYA